MATQGIIATAQITKNGRRALAASYGYDIVNHKAVYRGITFTGGGVSELPLDDIDNAGVESFSASTGKISNIVTVGNTLRVFVSYNGNGTTARLFSLHCMYNNTDIVFAVCNTGDDGIALSTRMTVCFSMMLAQETSDGTEYPDMSLVNGVNATVEDVGALRSDVEDRIDEISDTVESLSNGYSNLGTALTTEEVTTTHATITDAEVTGTATCNAVEFVNMLPKKVSEHDGNIGKLDLPINSITSGAYVGRTALTENYGLLHDPYVNYPIGSSYKSINADNTPDAVLCSIASTFNMDEASHAEIVLTGHATTKDTVSPRIVLRASQDSTSAELSVSHEGVSVSSDLSVEGSTALKNTTITTLDVGYLHIAGNYVSVPFFNGSSVAALEDTTGINPLNIQARVLPSGDKACIGSSEKRWKLYAEQADVSGLSFSQLPEKTGLGNTQKVSFPKGCVTMLCTPTKEVNVCDVLNGEADVLRIWHDVGGSASGTLVQTKNKFIAMSGAVAGRPFLAMCIE